MSTLAPQDSLFGIIIGPLLWSAFFVLSYIVSGSGCAVGYGNLTLAGVELLRLLIIALAVTTALLITAALLQAIKQRRKASDAGREEIETTNDAGSSPDENTAVTWQRRQFMATASAALSGLSLVGVLWLTMNVIVGPIC